MTDLANNTFNKKLKSRSTYESITWRTVITRNMAGTIRLIYLCCVNNCDPNNISQSEPITDACGAPDVCEL